MWPVVRYLRTLHRPCWLLHLFGIHGISGNYLFQSGRGQQLRSRLLQVRLGDVDDGEAGIARARPGALGAAAQRGGGRLELPRLHVEAVQPDAPVGGAAERAAVRIVREVAKEVVGRAADVVAAALAYAPLPFDAPERARVGSQHRRGERRVVGEQVPQRGLLALAHRAVHACAQQVQ